MTVVRHGSMSKSGFERAIEILTQLVELLSTIELDIGGDESCVTSDVEVTLSSIYVLLVLFVRWPLQHMHIIVDLQTGWSRCWSMWR
jgi:hypothetical protein